MATLSSNSSPAVPDLANSDTPKPISPAPGRAALQNTTTAKAPKTTIGTRSRTAKAAARSVPAAAPEASNTDAPTFVRPAAKKNTVKASVKGNSREGVAPKPVTPELPRIEKPLKEKKPKLVRDSFTIPKLEYLLLDQLKHRGGALGMAIKKSELIRAGIKALAAMPDADFQSAVKAVPTIKTGRPPNN